MMTGSCTGQYNLIPTHLEALDRDTVKNIHDAHSNDLNDRVLDIEMGACRGKETEELRRYIS